MPVLLRRMRPWLLLGLCIAAVIVIDPTAMPPERLWNREFTKLRKQVDALPSDLAKTTFLREYVGGLIDLGQLDSATKEFYKSVDFESFDVAQFYPRFHAHSLAAECGITTFFYIKLLQAFGFSAYQYSFGFTEEPYTRFIHSVVLVDIAFEGRRRLIIQDPYLDLSYREVDGTPLDFFDFLARIQGSQFDRIVVESSGVMTSVLVPDLAVYYAHLDDLCRKLMDAAVRRPDGSLRSRIPLLRNYANLMQSPCGNYEAAFLEAMRAHGLEGPLIDSYRLRASDLVGSADHSDLQARIDEVLKDKPGSMGAGSAAR